MFLYLLLIMVFSKSYLLPVIPIWEEKILIKELWIISLKFSKKNTTEISLMIKLLSKNSKEKLKNKKELYLPFMKLKLKSMIYKKVLMLLKLSLELNSKNLILIFSKKLLNQSKLS